MNEANQIQRDIRRRLEKMSLQELKDMHAKTVEIMEKWQLKPASPSLEHPIVKRIEEIDKTRQNEFIVGTPGSAKNYGFEPEDRKNFFELQKENERIDEIGKRLENYLEKEHGVNTTPFMEYKNGEFHFEKDEGNVSFKIVEGKDDHFEIHIENEDYEDGWEPFTAFHKDELDLDLKPEMEQQQETHEMTMDR